MKPTIFDYRYFPHNGKFYKAVTYGGGITRNDANNECRAEGGELASVHDDETTEFLDSLRKIRSYIGGEYVNGKWTWSDGSPWDYENWRPGDPSNPLYERYNEMVHNGEWNSEDNIIGYNNGYICQKDSYDFSSASDHNDGYHLKDINLQVDSCSSVFLSRNNYWGPELALTEVSYSNTGYWHSDNGDEDPWIKFKVAEELEVVTVEITDRQTCCFERFQNVEVVIIGSSGKSNKYLKLTMIFPCS